MTNYTTPNFSLDLSDQVALVTGSSSGLGYRFSKILAKCGAKVALAARRGDNLQALEKEIRKEQICELGNILLGKSRGRVNSNDITVVDLTGVAVQDIQIVTAIFELYLEKKNEI